MNKTIIFHGGTLVVLGASEEEVFPPPFQWIKGRWRCEGYHYGTLLPWLRQQDIRDHVPRWVPLDCPLHETREPHAYQLAALKAWEGASRRGSIVLPTGAGKTFIAIQAISQVNRSTIVVAPTVDLLHQWYARLVNAFATQVGVYYGGEKIVLPLTVTTYHSAGDLLADYGQQFKLIIFDEVHHLPAPSWGEAALMAPAPARLGLTATYPEEHEQTGERWRVDELVGPIVFLQRLDELVGEQLALYRTQRVRVDLTAAERLCYETDHALYMQFVKENRLQRLYGPHWLRELMRLSATDRLARRAFLARQRVARLLSCCEGKLQALDALLREHEGEQILIFTEYNDLVYQIAQRHLIFPITHETAAAERKHILEGFREGRYRVIVTSRVLNEGVDVPEAKVAIVLGGTAGAREYIQRLGRILRKHEQRQAVLYEVLVRKTTEEGKAQRRRAAHKRAEDLYAYQ